MEKLTWTQHRYTLVSDEGTPSKPLPSTKNVTGHAENITSFARRLLQAPHAEVKSGTGAEQPRHCESSRPVATL